MSVGRRGVMEWGDLKNLVGATEDNTALFTCFIRIHVSGSSEGTETMLL